MSLLVLLAAFLLVSPVQAAEPETLTLADGGMIEVIVVRPPATIKETVGLVLCLGGGPGDRSQAEHTLSFFQGLVARGWVAVAPVSPDGKPLSGANGAKMPQVIQLLQKRPGVPRGKVLLAGVSNGGIAAFEIAATIPQQVLGVIALPGVLSPATDLDALRDMPVYLRLGGKDSLHWGDLYPSTVEQLTRAHAKLDAKLLPSAGHGVPINWDELDPWLSGLRPKPGPAAAPGH